MEPLAIDAPHIDEPRLRLALADPETFQPLKRDKKWFPAIQQLPPLLREVLLVEMDNGNTVSSIQAANWPHTGSVMVIVAKPFFTDHTATRPALTLHHMNDPHYWMTDIYQTVDGVQHMIVN